jgi:SHS family lactate transporter-like MFS transporter
MAPYFIRNLVPRRQAQDANRKPLSQVLLSLTWIQWAQFLTGYDPVLS